MATDGTTSTRLHTGVCLQPSPPAHTVLGRTVGTKRCARLSFHFRRRKGGASSALMSPVTLASRPSA